MRWSAAVHHRATSGKHTSRYGPVVLYSGAAPDIQLPPVSRISPRSARCPIQLRATSRAANARLGSYRMRLEDEQTQERKNKEGKAAGGCMGKGKRRRRKTREATRQSGKGKGIASAETEAPKYAINYNLWLCDRSLWQKRYLFVFFCIYLRATLCLDLCVGAGRSLCCAMRH